MDNIQGRGLVMDYSIQGRGLVMDYSIQGRGEVFLLVATHHRNMRPDSQSPHKLRSILSIAS